MFARLIGRLAAVAFIAICVLPAVSSAAEFCVRTDESRDNMGKEEIGSATVLIEQEIEALGHTVLEPGCVNELVVNQVKLGSSVTVSLRYNNNTEKMKAKNLDDLPSVYSQLVRQVVSGDSKTAAMTRHNVTEAQAKPRRAKADFLTTYKIGALVRTQGGPVGPQFGAGVRLELDEWAVEAQASLGLTLDDDPNDDDSDVSVDLAGHLGAVYFFDGEANMSPFVAFGAGYSMGALKVENNSWAGNGFDFRVAAGYEFFRASTFRLFVQTEALLPAYALQAAKDNTAQDSRYNATFLVSLGLGWKPQPTTTNRVRIELD